MSKYWRHFKTITKHKWYVMIACFKCGLVWQGITHDLSKYSKTEFCASAKHFQGNSSPIDAEKRAVGYSAAWQNHKGKNKHHWQYWTDFDKGNLILLRMPPKYVAEMLCDWVGAGKAYNKGSWTIDTLKMWYEKCHETIYLHTSTKAYIDMLMKHVKDEADLFEKWIKVSRIHENYALDDCEDCPDSCSVETPKDSRNIVTNADRIRSMTDEELAKELTRHPPIPCRVCEYYNHKHANCGAPNGFVCVTEYAEALTLDWLKQPVKEE